MNDSGKLFDEEYTQRQATRGTLRRLVRRIYLRNVLRFVKEKSIDFGCGIGELLELLPMGSVGYEVNEASVRYCTERGLDVRFYRPVTDRYRFEDCNHGEFTTFIMSHVLEHLERPHDVLRTILRSCTRLGIERIIIIVPGKKGFQHDKTHRTFVDRKFIESHRMRQFEGYNLMHEIYFPLPFSGGGSLFTHNEYIVIYDRSQ